MGVVFLRFMKNIQSDKSCFRLIIQAILKHFKIFVYLFITSAWLEDNL